MALKKIIWMNCLNFKDREKLPSIQAAFFRNKKKNRILTGSPNDFLKVFRDIENGATSTLPFSPILLSVYPHS